MELLSCALIFTKALLSTGNFLIQYSPGTSGPWLKGTGDHGDHYLRVLSQDQSLYVITQHTNDETAVGNFMYSVGDRTKARWVIAESSGVHKCFQIHR